MKKIKIILYLGILLCVGNACSGELDQAPSGKISLEEVFKDNEKTMYYLNTCYRYIPVKGARYFFWSRGPVCWSDEAWDADDLDVNWASSSLFYNGNASASSHPVWSVGGEDKAMSYWDHYFSVIRNCSVFLANIETANVTNEADRKRWTAEAHLLRAYYYSELLRWFGCGLPIIKEAYELSQDFSEVTRSSYYEVVKFIIEDCDIALANSELPWRISTSSEQLRVTKALAEAIKARMILYSASPLYNDGENHWEEAYSIIKTSLANLRANGYELYNKVNQPSTYSSADAFLPNQYSQLFNEYFCTSATYSTTPADKETIYQLEDGQGDLANVDGIGAILGYKTGTCPSQELVDAFETIDGKPILDLSKPYVDEETHLVPNYNTQNTLYDPQNPYENRDPRFYASIYYNGSKRKCGWTFDETSTNYENFPASAGNRARVIATWAVDENNPENGGESRTGLSATARNKTRTGYYQRKFLHPFSGNENRLGGARYKDFRLGEVVLSFAEAAAEAGHLSEAYTAVNEIRARVGMPNLPEGLSKNELILRIHNERRVELALEGHRYFDVRRWSDPSGNLNKTDRYVTAIYITRKKDGTYKYERSQVNGNERKCYTNKYLKAAIPLNEVNSIIAITGENWQNTGW
ncbi:MAG: RagB/SusD family nutrient uptake outer membrane protein, partial [Massilibacteroides sp.]|nr:RagB/SusD family nutrient uptake outer membrane protein [Massilibacteroides sp.]MDD3061891.1 RagB/SusD family nutrient uptake outer membrane protein [Massilibacteroides sp.]MDD4116004.1 RagB/SusD family nutrient uptake outer membrane protein [Massilibacteroides sp.]MDD4660652.1 RagB/SusD family nutrient uptake outer membrane protein [Massilibacteroides sp.]